jgi:DNA mismatch repair protein MutS
MIFYEGDTSKLTPMVRQYLEIKEAHQDCILFFRLGDFYEMFFDDAKEASSILSITLTARNRGDELKIPMCGIPYHSAEGYIQKLLDAGKKIAICEQIGDPLQTKGIVERRVVQIITPALRPNDFRQTSATYLASVAIGRRDDQQLQFELAYLDISTGECRTVELRSEHELLDELARVAPKELLWPKGFRDHRLCVALQKLFPKLLVNFVNSSEPLSRQGEEILPGARLSYAAAREGNVSPPPNSTSVLTKSAMDSLFSYLKRAQYTSLGHIQKVERYEIQKTMRLDAPTIRNLELFETQYERTAYGSLFWLLDRTSTAMGRRLLRQWLLYPLLNVEEISIRQRQVSQFFEKQALRESIQKKLKELLDLERIIGRLTLGFSNARDLLALRNAFQMIPELNYLFQSEGVHFSIRAFSDLRAQALSDLLSRAIVDDPPLSLKEGGMIREGFNKELDELILVLRDTKTYLANLERRERERTAIQSLKVRFNQVFGYYIEITKANLSSVPADYIRKQTLVNCERFITPELKEFEEKILTAETRRFELEYQLFEEIRAAVVESAVSLLKGVHELAEIDVYCSLAEVAAEQNYVCPQLTDNFDIEIKEGRHPVIEKLLSERFVPNDIHLDNEKNLILIITGPNMAGKSTVMRQTALIVLLSQIGSFVPASLAKIGLVDRIFTRVGAQDHLSKGESTFMVEMRETAEILKFATERSLILLDEIGRGTSTFDGMSIAWSVAAYIHDTLKAKTLFATHYHELVALASEKPKVANFHAAVTQIGEEVVFIRKLKPGGMGRSYGIHVARLAGLPTAVVEGSKVILRRLEDGSSPQNS